MIDIKSLTAADIGKWVEFTLYTPPEKGRIKSWNDKYIFVVYKCANEWHRYYEFTGQATDPTHLQFIN